MARISGAQSYLAMRHNAIATAYGTNLAAGAGHLTPYDSLTWNENAGELVNSSLGLGKIMHTDATRGATEPSFSITKTPYFLDGTAVILGTFFGTAGTPSEVTASQGDYKHTLTLNASLNNCYSSVAVTDSSSTTLDFISAACESFTFTAGDPPSYPKITGNFKCRNVELSSAVNTYAVVSAATLTDDEEMIIDQDDVFWIDTEASIALASGDALAITSYTINLQRPQKVIHEVKGTATNTAPEPTDVVAGTVSITLAGAADHTYHAIAQAGTSYKCKFMLSGSTIASGTAKSLAFYVPKMKLIQSPDAPMSAPSNNPMTLTFKILAASSAPTGMSSVYPYVELVNTRSTAYIA